MQIDYNMTGKIKRLAKGSGQVCSNGQGSGVRESGQKGHVSLPRRNYVSTAVHQRAGWRTQCQTSVRGDSVHKNENVV